MAARQVHFRTLLLLMTIHKAQLLVPTHGLNKYQRIMRWHSFHNEAILVGNMRSECMGSGLRVLNISMIVNGGECVENKSLLYLTELQYDIERCSAEQDCQQVTWDPKKLSPSSDCVIYLSSRASVCLAYMVQYRQPCLDHFYTEMNRLTVSALDIQYTCNPLPNNLKVSVITSTEWDHINIGHMITECNSQHENQYLNIAGFVEVSNHCPGDKSNYIPPEYHQMVKVLQDHVERANPLIDYAEYRYNLTLRVICGNMLIPVMLDGLMALRSIQGWIYYECGTHHTFNYTWNHHWFNVSSQYKNSSHTLHHTSSTSTHCPHAGPVKLLIVAALVLLAGALVAEAFTVYKREQIIRWFSQPTPSVGRVHRVSSDMCSAVSARTSLTTLSTTSGRQNHHHNINGQATIPLSPISAHTTNTQPPIPFSSHTTATGRQETAFSNYQQEMINTVMDSPVTRAEAEPQDMDLIVRRQQQM